MNPSTHVPINTVQVSNGKVLVPFQSGLAVGWMEGPPTLARAPIARPKIRMPLLLWRQALSFLVSVFDGVKIEAQAIFYYKEATDEWSVMVPHQYGSGGTTSTFECLENEQMFDFLAQEGYECVGSVHSHCNMSAFQSGTDKDDEFGTNDGFHITIGKMSDTVMDIHCRSIATILGDPTTGTKAQRLQLPFYLEDFISGLPDFDTMTIPPPLRIRSEWIKYILANREDLEPYNDDWDERINLTDPTKKKYPTNGAVSAGVKGGAMFLIAGVPHNLIDGKMVPIKDEDEAAVNKVKGDRQWWLEQREQEERLLRQLDEEEEKEELEAEEMRILKEREMREQSAKECAEIYGID